MMTQKSQEAGRSKTLWFTRGILLIRGVLLAAAVVMIVAGLANGEARTVLQKAVNICLECIGIG